MGNGFSLHSIHNNFGSKQPQNQNISVVLFLDVRQPRREAGSSSASPPTVTNERIFASTPPK